MTKAPEASVTSSRGFGSTIRWAPCSCDDRSGGERPTLVAFTRGGAPGTAACVGSPTPKGAVTTGSAKGSRCKSDAAPATVTGDGPETHPLVAADHLQSGWSDGWEGFGIPDDPEARRPAPSHAGASMVGAP